MIADENNADIKLPFVPSDQLGERPTIWRYHGSGNSAVVAVMELYGFRSEHDLRHDAQQYGHVSAVFIGHALLWHACRHHVGEVIIMLVFNI